MLRLSLRRVARESKITPSLLSRLENGREVVLSKGLRVIRYLAI